MFGIIKRLFGRRKSMNDSQPDPKEIVERTVKVQCNQVITQELVLASMISVLKVLISMNAFNKDYACIKKFISQDAPTCNQEDLLRLVDIMDVNPEMLYKTGIIALAKKYTFLNCKSCSDNFDNWMHECSKIVYTP